MRIYPTLSTHSGSPDRRAQNLGRREAATTRERRKCSARDRVRSAVEAASANRRGLEIDTATRRGADEFEDDLRMLIGSRVADQTEIVNSTERSLEFRSGALDDAVGIAEYHHRCWLTSFATVFEPGVVEFMDPLGRVDRFRFWLSPGSEMTTEVATENGVVVGHAIVEGNEIVHLFVDPHRQGLGIGRLLLQGAERRIVASGFVDAEVHKMVGNHPAIGLYRSAGWQMTDQLIGSEHDGLSYDEHVLVKRLKIDAGGRR